MQHKTISYGRTKNLGNYESERMDATIELGEYDDPIFMLVQLKKFVTDQLYPEQAIGQVAAIPATELPKS